MWCHDFFCGSEFVGNDFVTQNKPVVENTIRVVKIREEQRNTRQFFIKNIQIWMSKVGG